MPNPTFYASIVNFIWGIADDVLRDVYVRGKYRDVILPMTVIRRLDVLLEPTKKSVLEMKERLDAMKLVQQESALCKTAGQAFYNVSPFTLSDLRNRSNPQQLKADFEAYLDGFSSNIQEILNKFKFRNQIATLVESDSLAFLIEKFLNSNINLGPLPVLNEDGTERMPALDNHAMGTVFEELIRRFNEENNEEAGEHFTPRDIVTLMADLVFLPVADKVQDGTYLVYDGACGTGGMLTLASERLAELAQKKDKKTVIRVYGQEVQPETYAIAKADMLIKGEAAVNSDIRYGSTLSADAFRTEEFDFMLSNPPYGKSWKKDLDLMGGKDSVEDPRFVITHDGDPEYSLITRSSDGQLMFLANKLSKMKDTPLGSRIAEVHNGSSLFTGDAGQGESNIRRWIIENDWLEAIVALPENMFYNTGIATYIWVLSNRKSPERKGKVQLIDATGWSQPLRKNLGSKNCELAPEHIDKITDLLSHPQETEQSKIFPNAAFGYWKITVERPLRLSADLGASKLASFASLCKSEKEPALATVAESLAQQIGAGPHLNFNVFMDAFNKAALAVDLKMTAKRKKLVQSGLCVKDQNAAKVIKKVHKKDVEADQLHGLFPIELHGKNQIVEYDADSELRDTEQIPLLEDGGIEAFFAREVLPWTDDAWIDKEQTKIGYEISFTRHFYKAVEMRSLEVIQSDILSIEKESADLLAEIFEDIK